MAKSKHSKNKKIQKEIARNRIEKLFYMAEQRAHVGEIDLADRYVHIARKISMRYLVPIPTDFKRRFCKHCYSYLMPSINSRVRIHRNKIINFCFNCKRYSRIPFKSK